MDTASADRDSSSPLRGNESPLPDLHQVIPELPDEITSGARKKLAALAASMSGQGEDETFFALSTSRSFGSGDSVPKPAIAMSGWDVDSLDFRVYRINDPPRFFQQLERPHEFGGRAPAPPRERTAIERVRLWKRSLRANIRRSLRAQFTESPSSHLQSFLPRRTAAVSHPLSAPLTASRRSRAPCAPHRAGTARLALDGRATAGRLGRPSLSENSDRYATLRGMPARHRRSCLPPVTPVQGRT
jgi:hypothetical protein